MVAGNGRPDFGELLGAVGQMHGQIERLRADIERAEATGRSPDGLVRATLQGDGSIAALSLDPSVLTPADPERVAYLVMAAVNDAHGALKAQHEQRFAPMAEGAREIAAELRRRRESRG